MNRENPVLAPNINEVVEFVVLGGSGDLHENPRNSNEAWNHHDHQEKIMWRNGINKEFNNMCKHEVCTKKQEISREQMVWKNRRKIAFNIAKVVILGHHRIPEIDNEDAFAPAINEISFRIIFVYMLRYGLKAYIVNFETVFLYGNLEEEKFMEKSEGFKNYDE